MSVGWISARWPPNTVYKSMPLAEFFQTTATINTGNSGGPMFNMAGRSSASSATTSRSPGKRGAGLRGHHQHRQKLLLERKSFWSGIDGTMLTGDLAAIFNLPEPAGFLVKTVAQGSAGWDMGLLGGDKIATIGRPADRRRAATSSSPWTIMPVGSGGQRREDPEPARRRATGNCLQDESAARRQDRRARRQDPVGGSTPGPSQISRRAV